MSRHQLVHMRTDGDAELDALFSVLNNREALLCSSFKNRKLPASFFTPPTPKHANMGHRGRQASSIHEYTQPEPLHCRSISSPSQAIDNYWNQQTSSKFYPGGSYQQQPCFSSFYDKQHPQNNINQPINNYDDFNNYNYQQQQLNQRQWQQHLPDNDLFFANKLFGFENFDLKELEKGSPMCDVSTPMEQQNCIQYELQALQQHKLRNQEKQQALANRELMLAELAKSTATLQPEELVQLKPPKQHNKQCYSDTPQHYQQHNRHFPNKQQQQQLKHNIQQQQFKQQQQQLKHNTQQHYLKNIETAFNDSHIRQNSTDSGLGGMGTTYSLPRSPDEYLSNVDEGDGREEDGDEKNRMEGIFN